MHRVIQRAFSGIIKYCQLTVLLLLTTCLLSAAESTQHAVAVLSNFRFSRLAEAPVKIPENAWGSIRLDREFYENIDLLNQDLRITAPDSATELPFMLHKVTDRTTLMREEQLPGRIIREQQLPDGRTAIDFELNSLPGGICSVELAGVLFSPGTELTIAVGDGRNWQQAIARHRLSDTSKFPEVTSRKYPFAADMQGKFIRLLLENGKFNRLEALRVFTKVPVEQPESTLSVPYELTDVQLVQADNITTLSCNTGRTPVTQLKITSSSKLYNCRVTISGSNDRRKWQTITAGTIRKVDMDRLETVDLPENRFRYLQVKIDHTQSGQLESLHISALGNCYEWVFPISQQTTQAVCVYYGNTGAILPPLPALTAQPGQFLSITYEVQRPAANTLRQTGVKDRGTWRYLLGALMLILTALAICVILPAMQKTNRTLPED